MRWSDWRRLAIVILLLSCFLGCADPSSSQSSPLTAASARDTLDNWNPNYCKVAEFYGFYKPGDNQEVAYVLIANPSDKTQKPQVYAARFQLLALPDGQSRWFLVSLITHNSGLSRRQGWDNLMIAVKNQPPGVAK